MSVVTKERRPLSRDYTAPTGYKTPASAAERNERALKLAHFLMGETQGEKIYLVDGVFSTAKDLARAFKQLGFFIENCGDGTYVAHRTR